MKQFIKQNIVVLIAFILPIILIAIVATIAYLPSLFLSTKYNFVYSSCPYTISNYDPYFCSRNLKTYYSIVGGKLVENPIDPNQDSNKNGVLDINERSNARIFFHDTQKNESREITLVEARALSLNDLLTSPDGVSVSSGYERRAEFLSLFGSGSNYGYYLTKGGSKTKLNLINDNDRYYYRDNFQFIGWVVPGRN